MMITNPHQQIVLVSVAVLMVVHHLMLFAV
jgi:hypothetical protein